MSLIYFRRAATVAVPNNSARQKYHSDVPVSEPSFSLIFHYLLSYNYIYVTVRQHVKQELLLRDTSSQCFTLLISFQEKPF